MSLLPVTQIYLKYFNDGWKVILQKKKSILMMLCASSLKKDRVKTERLNNNFEKL